MKTLQQMYDKHPNLVMWAALALGMVVVLALAARNVGFTASQWAALVAATVALAGLCVWIISWENDQSSE
jgi:predicted tellurium resistance membrane protein TerC